MEWTSYPVTEQIHISAFYSMFRIALGKTYVFQGETHNFWECVYVESGSICVSADERVYKMNAGEIIFHKPYELHKFYNTGEENTTLFIFSYSAEGSLSNYFCDKVFYLSDKQQKTVENLVDYMENQINASDVPDKKEVMYLLPFKTNPSYSQTVTTQIYSLLFSLINSSESIPVSTSRESVIFAEAVNFMNKKADGNPSVGEIAKQVGISRTGLKRIFKRYSGLGVHEYFLKLKLKRATKLLEKGLSVTDTAEKMGFSSQGYFTRVFKRELGILPSSVSKHAD